MASTTLVQIMSDMNELEARIRELEDALTLNHARYVKPFKLTQMQARILALLMVEPVVSSLALQQRVGMNTEAKVAINRLRQKLAPYEVEIKSKRFHGFWIEPEDKEKVEALL